MNNTSFRASLCEELNRFIKCDCWVQILPSDCTGNTILGKITLSHCKPHGHQCFKIDFYSINVPLKAHPSICMSHQEVLLDRGPRLLYQSHFTDDEKDCVGDR